MGTYLTFYTKRGKDPEEVNKLWVKFSGEELEYLKERRAYDKVL